MFPDRIPASLRRDILRAIKEDAPKGDITSISTISAEKRSRAFVIAKKRTVAAGLMVFREVMKAVDPKTSVSLLVKDGREVRPGQKMVRVDGRARSILKGERVALNYLQRMCGIASATAAFVAKTAGTRAVILDTRKTTPNLRMLEKYAVTCGGGKNHRFSLSDAPLIKENHIRAVGGIAKAVAGVKRKQKRPVILEVTDAREVLEGIESGVEILLLDNMTPAQVKKMVKLISGRALVEVSGGVNLENVRLYAKAGADRISIGSITHSAPAADISLLID